MELLGWGLVLVALVALSIRLFSDKKQPPQNRRRRQPPTKSVNSRARRKLGPQPRRPTKGEVASQHPPPPAIPASRQLCGKAWVIDGDTIVVNKIKVRLFGIDAPELDEPWGQRAKWEMVALTKGQRITVYLNGQTSYDRLVGTCLLPDGTDLSEALIKAGLALDFPHYSQGVYRQFESPELRRKLSYLRKKWYLQETATKPKV